MSLDLIRLYQSQYQTLLTRRQNIIFQLEEISNQISDLKREARKDRVELIN